MTVQGTEFVGTIHTTWNGRTCQRWDQHSPHSHTYTDPSYFPGGSIPGASNYCRNPNMDLADRPWCYTTDPNVRWDYCNIIMCN